jgi:hypothetical protein
MNRSMHHRHRPNRRRALSRAAAGLLAMMLAGADRSTWGQESDSPVTAELASDIESYTEVLRQTQSNAELRTWAAQRLIRINTEPAITALDRALRDADQTLVGLVLNALSAEQASPDGLLDALAQALSASTGERSTQIVGIIARYDERGCARLIELAGRVDAPAASRVAAVRALSDFRSASTAPLCVDALLNLLAGSPSLPPALVEVVFDALERITGRAGSPRDVADWRAWWNRTRDEPVESWLPMEVEHLRGSNAALSRDLQRIRADRDALRRQLEASMADVYFLLRDQPDGAVMRKLAEWLGNDVPAVREIAVRRIDTILANAGTILIPDDVQTALAARLTDESPATRAVAARVMARLNPPGIADRLGEMLAAESDVAVRRQVLELLATKSSPAAIDAIIDCLAMPELRDFAAAAGARALADRVIPQEHMAAMREAARLAYQGGQSVPCLNFLATIGDVDDIRSLLPLLDHANENIRRAAASALARRTEAHSALFARTADPAVLGALIGLLADGEPTLPQLDRLLALPMPSGNGVRDQWVAGIERFIARAAMGDLAGLIARLQAVPDASLAPDRRATLIAAAGQRIADAPPDAIAPEAREPVILALAAVRLSLGEFDAALASLDLLNGSVAAATPLRLQALACLGRYEDAIRHAPEPAPWIVLLRHFSAVDLARALEVRDEIERRFPQLNGDLKTEFDALASALDGGEIRSTADDADDNGGGRDE